MAHLGFKPCRADPDVWMRPAMKPDGHHYFEYVLLYTDNCLVVSHRGESVLRDKIGKYFELKEESIGAPDILQSILEANYAKSNSQMGTRPGPLVLHNMFKLPLLTLRNILVNKI
jgi:hypothetical protein